jgi:hypothetical protein
MELNTERRIVRLALIVSIICGMSWIGLWLFSDTVDSQNDVILGTKIAVSGFGEINLFNPQKAGLSSTDIYQDVQLGFQISKPNKDWEIHSMTDDLSSNELDSLQTKGFVDGIYIEKNHNKQFILTVFDIQEEEFTLHEFVDQQISLMKSQKNITVQSEQISPENDWALFAIEFSDNTMPYGEQLLFLKDNRLYMLQYFGESPQTLDFVQKNDFKFIMDSFEVV